MKSDYKVECCTINYYVSEYRRSFLKRKNINGYKKIGKGTPILLDKMLNAFDRKINGKSIFTEEVKIQYFNGLKEIFSKYYDETFLPKMSRKDAYISYLADQYIIYGKEKYVSISLSFNEFKKSGMIRRYRNKDLPILLVI